MNSIFNISMLNLKNLSFDNGLLWLSVPRVFQEIRTWKEPGIFLNLTWDSAPFQSSVASPSPDISSFQVLKYRRTDYFVCLDYCSVWLLPRKFRPFETWRALAAFPIWPTNTRAVITIQFRQKNMITFQAFCTSEGIHSLLSTSP